MLDEHYSATAWQQDKANQVKRPETGLRYATWSKGSIKLPWSQHYANVEPYHQLSFGVNNSKRIGAGEIGWNHSRLQYTDYKGFTSFLMNLLGGGYVYALLGVLYLLSGFLLYFSNYEDPTPPNLTDLLITFSIVCFGVSCRILFSYLEKHPEWFATDNGDGFFRQTGMVKVKKRFGLVSYPFTDFDAFVDLHVDTTSGQIYTNLAVVHRNQKAVFYLNLAGELQATPQQHYLCWEMLQRFMDVSQPLPDIPQLEPFRPLDATTAAHDKATGRKADKWKKMSPKWFEQRVAKKLKKEQTRFNWEDIPDLFDQQTQQQKQQQALKAEQEAAALKSGKVKRCPSCKELVAKLAASCEHCGYQINQYDASQFVMTLHQAINMGDWAMAKQHLEQGADANGVDPKGHTPLQIATKRGDQLIISLLCDYGGK
ncbi:hypothetical protein [Motilimonas sp. E26]|uniref:zinc ribbon domain-containing protein n=1 Tax=Motilimonas sp. E26 TaxID=2865674 RepID=UPI001E575997|nr:hypothetical protein [Motilimonas sp. E26]MCE0555889.1 hypothetical protein [Motilimonas sp. E26]